MSDERDPLNEVELIALALSESVPRDALCKEYAERLQTAAIKIRTGRQELLERAVLAESKLAAMGRMIKASSKKVSDSLERLRDSPLILAPAMSDNPFHDHCDVCSHCRQNPFDLCADGEVAMKATKDRLFAEGLADTERAADEGLLRALGAASQEIYEKTVRR